MARTTRNPISVAYTGAAVTATAVDNANGEQFAYAGGRNKLVVANASGASINVTVRRNYTTADGGVAPDNVVAIPTATTKIILEGPAEVQSDGMVYVDYSAGTSVTAWLLQA